MPVIKPTKRFIETLDQLIREEIKALADNQIVTEGGKVRKAVVRGGKKKIVYTSSAAGSKVVGGKAVRMSGQEKIARKKGAKVAARKRKSKANVINRKRAKSMSRRAKMGM